MIKTVWKRNVPVEAHPHDECSSGHRVPVKLPRKMSFPIYGCANASPSASLPLPPQPNSFSSCRAGKGQHRSADWIQLSLLSCASEAMHALVEAMHSLVLPPSCRPLQRRMHPLQVPASGGNCPPADFSIEGINPNK